MYMNKNNMPITESIWEGTKTFFPIFKDYLENKKDSKITVCIIGASDGRFVIPLAKKGYKIIAIENDPLLLNGGDVKVSENKTIKVLGLKERLKVENLVSNVEIIEDNFFDVNIDFLVDAIFTSSTWDCSINHNRSLSEYIEKMKSAVKVNGIFCSEYMMPCEEKHKNIEHYLGEGEINKYFNNWKTIEEFYTPVFKDDPHIGKLVPHIHRMGFFMGQKN